MKILLVDDDRKRSDALVEHLVESCVAPIDGISQVESVQDAKKLLRNIYYDALVLDVVLPKRKGEKCHSKNGLEILNELGRSSLLRKPERIIGITAHLADIANFRIEFDSLCLAIIEADLSSDSWKIRISNALKLTSSSQVARANEKMPIHVVAIHGIRTFGEWQNRFKNLIANEVFDINFHSYKYGYFSIFSFLIPSLRDREIKKLIMHLSYLRNKFPDDAFYFFSHSFGTLLTAEALKAIISAGAAINVKVVVLAGSVLPEEYDWNYLKAINGSLLVNDCGDSDLVLLLSKSFVLGTGMAGKIGFHGFDGIYMINRFFKGGHSHYFRTDSFMQTYLLPLLGGLSPAIGVDERKPSPFWHGIIDSAASFLGSIKRYLYVVLFLDLFWLLVVNRTK